MAPSLSPLPPPPPPQAPAEQLACSSCLWDSQQLLGVGHTGVTIHASANARGVREREPSGQQDTFLPALKFCIGRHHIRAHQGASLGTNPAQQAAWSVPAPGGLPSHLLLPAESPAVLPAAFPGAPGKSKGSQARSWTHTELCFKPVVWTTERGACSSAPAPSTCLQEGRPRSTQVGPRYQVLDGKERGPCKGSFFSVAPGHRPSAKKTFLVLFAADSYIPEFQLYWTGAGLMLGERPYLSWLQGKGIKRT